MKKIIAGICAAVLLIGAVGVKLWLGHYATSANIASFSQKLTGSPLRLGAEPVLSFFPLRIEATDLGWQSPDGSLAITVKKFIGSLDFWELFSGRFQIGELELDSPRLEWQLDQGSRKSSAATGKSAGSGQGSDRGGFPVIDSLAIFNGQAVFAGKTGSVKLDDLHLSAKNLGLKQESAVMCDFGLEVGDAGGSRPNLKGNLAVKTMLRYYRPNLSFRETAATFTSTGQDAMAAFSPLRLTFDGSMNLEDWTARAAQVEAALPQGTVRGSIEGSFLTGKYGGEAAIETDLQKAGLLAGNPGSGKPAQVSAEGKFSLDTEALEVPNLLLKFGTACGSGHFDLSFGAVPRFAGALRLGTLDLASLLDAGEGGPAVPAAAAADSKKTQPDKESAAPAHWPAVDFDCGVEAISYKNLRFSNVAFSLKGGGDSFALENLAADWANGKIAGTAKTHLPAGTLELNVKANDLDFGQALKEFGIDGVQGGVAEADVDLSASGASAAELARTLSGRGTLNCKGAKILALVEIAHMLPFPRGGSFVFPDQVDSLTLKFAGDKGLFVIRPMDIQAGSVTLAGAATADLPKERIDGTLAVKAMKAILPIHFNGPFNDISWSMGDGFFDELRKLIP